MTRRALVVILLVGLAAAGMRVTVAAFSSATANAGNGYAAGTVNLTDNDSGAMLSLSSAVAGATDTSCVRLSYDGSLDAHVRHYATVAGTLAPYLSLKVTKGSGSAGFDSCTGFTADSTDYIGAGAGVIYDGKLSGFPTSWSAGIVDPNGGSSYSSTVLGTSGLVGYWRLGESSGTTAVDEKAANPGIYWAGSGYTLGQPGALERDANTAVDLDGVTGFAYVPDAAALEPTAALSVEAWVKPDSLTGTRWFVVKDTFYYLYAVDGVTYFGVATTTLGYQFVTTTSVTTGAWQHLVGTYDGTTLNLYRNGVKVATGPASGPVATGTGALYFGVYGPPAQGYYDGDLDEIALYDSGLTAATVANHYAAALQAETWTNPESHDYKFQITLDNDAAALGKSSTATFQWEAQNT